MADGVVSPSDLSDWLIGRGRHFVTTEEVAELVGVAPSSVPISLQRARDARKVASVTKGGWIPVPPEYREAGAPPPLHYIDPMMRHLGHPYYVGFLSAARLHGASHQVPMVLQVVTPALLRSRRIGQNRIQYIRRGGTARRQTQQHDVATGRVTIASPATVVLDIVDAPDLAGGFGNVATVVGDLIGEDLIYGAALADAAEGYPASVVQRAGHLIEHMATEVGAPVDLGPLHHIVAGAGYAPLDPRAPAVGDRDEHWHVIRNTTIEHEQ